MSLCYLNFHIVLTTVICYTDDLDEFVDDADAEGDAEVEPEPEREYSSLKDMLNDGVEDDYYGYDDY